MLYCLVKLFCLALRNQTEASVDEACKMLDDCRKAVGLSIITDINILDSAFIDTNYGAVLDYERLISLLKTSHIAKKYTIKAVEETMAAIKAFFESQNTKRPKFIDEFEERQSLFRNLYGDAFVVVRSLAELRAN